jgi:23S rRNA (adenine1618-N6)-methyltransferase
MHPKNPFIKDYDFEILIANKAELKEFVFVNEHGNTTIKFHDKQAVKTLNQALLQTHYGILWQIPENNLCPPVPGRLDYLLHVSDLINKTDIRLLDIGTGANLIYPILATCHFNWHCTGSEVNEEALQNAQEIINQNSILQKTTLRRQKFKSNILNYVIEPDDFFDVVVCNPPFSKDLKEAQRKNQRKITNLDLPTSEKRNFGGTPSELWYKGGEEAFLKKMAQESTLFKTQVQWFTSLISKKKNLKNIKRAIKKTNPTEIKVIPMEHGNKKSHIIAWTFNT